jgi:lipopolysaccharide transport protein LptA
VRCGRFIAALDPESGVTQRVDFYEDVAFRRGPQRATGASASYSAEMQTLELSGDPGLEDEEEGTRLVANTLVIGTSSGDVRARGDVTSERRGGGGVGMIGTGDEGGRTLITCQAFDYEAASGTAVYRERALLRSGQDDVRAEELRIQEQQDGTRRLTARGGVVSRIQPEPAAPDAAAPALVESRSDEMVYDEAKGVVTYTGVVEIRQGDIATESPSATLRLGPGGTSVRELVAGEPVRVQQGERQAYGRTATYSPEQETMVLVGEPVIVNDPSQEVRGRLVTFKVGAETIAVEGQEEARTQMIIRGQNPEP